MSFPQNVQPIGRKETFHFRCHPQVPCFNECCRELELALTPYDVLRLRDSLNLTSAEFLARHAVVEFTESHQFPLVYLGMVDDGKASCPFVTGEGCLVYIDRPGACRTYPVGRGASMGQNRQVHEQFIILREQHCLGSADAQKQNIEQWVENQEITPYNRYNDLLMALTQHPKMKRGMRLSQEQADLFITALYDPDSFRTSRLFLDQVSDNSAIDENYIDNTRILENAIEILVKEFFR